MSDEWVVLELSPKAEGEDPDLIYASIRHIIKDAEIFLPVSVTNVGEDRLVNYLVDGYAFIKRVHPDARYFKLEGTRYVQSVITRLERGSGRLVRKVACATDADIERFKSQIHDKEDQGIGVGDTVLVTSGPYRQIRAIVIEDIPENESVQVHVKLRSKESLVMLPRSFLRLVEKAPHTSFLPRAAALRTWLKGIQPIALLEDQQLVVIQERFEIVDRFDRWITSGSKLLSAIRAKEGPDLDARPLARAFVRARHFAAAHALQVVETPLDPLPMLESLRGFEVLQRCTDRVRDLAPLFTPPAVKLAAVEGAYKKWAGLQALMSRVSTLHAEVDRLEKMLLGKLMTENVVVDGHQLAIRCATVPGLDVLTDSKGRPTGAILGFLRSLGSFRKKFPGAKITVVWDGSPQRRRQACAYYKANRQPLRASFEIEFLKELLPLLGIEQAWNPEEEADDVIASLLRGPYKGQENVVVSTDRDFLQLVTVTDHVLVPAVGSGKERLYTIEAVEKEYGVRPEKMVHFRAIDGDTSDNLPGASGFGPKMASKLLGLYGTIDGIFASNLAGLTPTQYQKLRAAEKQVRLNVSLMALLTDLPFTVLAPNPDQKAATQRLQDVDVKVDAFLPVFFPAGV